MKRHVYFVMTLVMLAAAAASWFTTPKEVHEANDFNFHPVQEVGYLFIGIFLTMIPALQLLAGGTSVTLDTPLQFYFASGTLSAFLDNAPTYLAFLATGMGHHGLDVGDRMQVLQFVQEDVFLLSFKRGINDKWTYNDIWNVEYWREFESHFSFKLGLMNWRQVAAGGLHFIAGGEPVDASSIPQEVEVITSEVTAELRWAAGHFRFSSAGKNAQ